MSIYNRMDPSCHDLKTSTSGSCHTPVASGVLRPCGPLCASNPAAAMACAAPLHPPAATSANKAARWRLPQAPQSKPFACLMPRSGPALMPLVLLLPVLLLLRLLPSTMAPGAVAWLHCNDSQRSTLLFGSVL